MFGVDDYPYLVPPVDPYGYAIKQCASFVNWRCMVDYHIGDVVDTNGPNNGGVFAQTLIDHGYPRDTNPRKYDVMSLPAGVGGAGEFGHVAVVLELLNPTTVLVEDYNWYDDLKYHQHQLNIADAVFVRLPLETDDMDIALLTRSDATADPHGPGAVYLAYGARRNNGFIPLTKRHVASPQDEKNYTDAGMAVEQVSGYLLDRAEDGPPVQAGDYPADQ